MDVTNEDLDHEALKLALASVKKSQDEVNRYRDKISEFEQNNPKFTGNEPLYKILNEASERLENANKCLHIASEHQVI
jgi:hypothetical protein